MTDEQFKKRYYEPFLETWKILKTIQNADQSAASDPQWQTYVNEIDELAKKFPENKFVEKLITLLYDSGDVIAKENGR